MKYKVNILINLMSNLEIEAESAKDAIEKAKAIVKADPILKSVNINQPAIIQEAKKNEKKK